MWVFVATEVGKERHKIAEGEKQCRKPQGRERETAGQGGGRAAQVIGWTDCRKEMCQEAEVVVGKAGRFWGSSPAWTCSSSSSALRQGQAASSRRAAGAEDIRSSRRGLPGHPEQDPAVGDHPGTPRASGAAGELAAGRHSKFPSPWCHSPTEGTLQRHLPLLKENNGSPRFATHSQRDVQSWHPPPPPLPPQESAVLQVLGSSLPCLPVPVSPGGRLLGHLLTRGRNQTGTFPAAAPGGICVPRAAPHPQGFFFGDISMSLCHPVLTRSLGTGSSHASRGICRTHAFGVFGSLWPIWFPSDRAPPGCCTVSHGCVLL